MPKTKPTTQNAEMPHHHNVGAETEKEEQESKISRTLQQPRVAIQLEFLGRLTDRLNRRPTGFYTGNAPKNAPK